jgi:cold shock protein
MTNNDSSHDAGQDSEQSSEHLTEVEGTVKWFDPRKGFGFIVGPDQQDIFVHFTVIEGDGFRVLKDGSIVTYDAEHNDKGWRATKVHRVEEPEEGSEAEVVVPRRTYSRTPRR